MYLMSVAVWPEQYVEEWPGRHVDISMVIIIRLPLFMLLDDLAGNGLNCIFNKQVPVRRRYLHYNSMRK